MRTSAPPPRGILHSDEPKGTIDHRRILPRAELSAIVQHFWSVRWSLREPFVARTLPHPTVHLTFEPAGAFLGGPSSKAFRRTLRGTGSVFGVKFQPAMAAVLWPGAVAAWDRRVPFARICAEAASWRAAIDSTKGVEERVERCEAFLLAHPRHEARAAARVSELVRSLETDRSIHSVAQLARRAGCSTRTLERAFETFLGQGPKQVLLRYRLIDAAEQLKAKRFTIAELANELGYFDQAHFVKDFRRTIGVAPSRFRASQ